uniref:Acyl carrier protein n=1 Tax=Myxococcus virescens TaxID=83456 RepID=A0A0N7AZ65_9BACT|nr:acyl carrier protein [Myxococcus virescens]
MQDTIEVIRAFLRQYFSKQTFEDTEEDIFAAGFVSSLFAMQLVVFLEKQFGFTIAQEDLDLNNFRSLSAMARFVASKR